MLSSRSCKSIRLDAGETGVVVVVVVVSRRVMIDVAKDVRGFIEFWRETWAEAFSFDLYVCSRGLLRLENVEKEEEEEEFLDRFFLVTLYTNIRREISNILNRGKEKEN